MPMTKDADAIGMAVDNYREQLTADLHERGKPGPGEIPVAWQMAHCLYEVDLRRPGLGVLRHSVCPLI